DGITSYATGKNFIPSHGITITFDGATVATTTANSTGAFYKIPFTVPATATVGPHTVSATDGTNMANATFTVISSLRTTQTFVTPNPSTAALSSTMTFHVKVKDTSASQTAPTGTVSWNDS